MQTVEAGAVKDERDPAESSASWLRFTVAVVAVAGLSAAFAIAIRSLLGATIRYAYGSTDIVSAFHSLPVWARLLLPCVGGVLAGAAAKLALVGGKSQGVGDVMEAAVLGRTQLSMRVTLLKSLGSFVAITTGGSIGREGPIIQFGGSAAAWIANLTGIDDRRRRTLVAAGTAAGFAAAYNTPLAAVLFVLEIVTGVVAVDTVLPTVAATALATGLTRAVAGGGPIYGQRAFELVSRTALLAHVGLGALAGLAAHLFMRMLSSAEAVFARSSAPQPLRAGLGGLVVGALAAGIPEVTGNGYEPLNAILDGRVALGVLAWLLIAKPLATTASVSSGSPGGVFTPTLLLGATLGSCFWSGLGLVVDPHLLGSAGSYALVGMAAVTAATTHGPVMAAVLVFELSGDYAIVLPLMLATTAATIVSRRLGRDSIYGAELRSRGIGWKVTLEDAAGR